MKEYKICFISHNATITGAPVVLLNFLKWLKANDKKGIRLLFLEGGEMLNEFQSLYPTDVLPSFHEPGFRGFFRRLIYRISGKDHWLKYNLRNLSDFNLLFFNTAASFNIISLLPVFHNTKMIAWLHEQPFSINRWYHTYFNAEILSRFSKILCVSTQTLDWLKADFNIPEKNLFIYKPFIDDAYLYNNDSLVTTNFDKIKFIVGGCGLQEMHKGPDLFLQVANHIKIFYPEVIIEFQWLGNEGEMSEFLRYDIDKMNLQSIIKFTHTEKNTNIFFSQISLLLLTSRVDSFPMVVLEAAAKNKPVLCFEDIGDITNVLSDVRENIIPYGRIDLLAERVLFYFRNRQLLIRDGIRMKERAMSYSVKQNANIMWEHLVTDLDF